MSRVDPERFHSKLTEGLLDKREQGLICNQLNLGRFFRVIEINRGVQAFVFITSVLFSHAGMIMMTSLLCAISPSDRLVSYLIISISIILLVLASSYNCTKLFK